MIALAGFLAAAVGALVAVLRWQRRRAERQRDQAIARAELAEGRDAAARDAIARTTAGQAGAQEVHDAAVPQPTDPVDPLEAARARVSRAEAAARGVRAHVDAARRDGRLPPK